MTSADEKFLDYLADRVCTEADDPIHAELGPGDQLRFLDQNQLEVIWVAPATDKMKDGGVNPWFRIGPLQENGVPTQDARNRWWRAMGGLGLRRVNRLRRLLGMQT